MGIMFAVVRTGGKQYRVAAGDKIAVEKLAGEAGEKITLGDVLLAGEEGKLADAGKIAQMPGVTATFEEPKTPDLVLQTDEISVEESVTRIIELMKTKGFINAGS